LVVCRYASIWWQLMAVSFQHPRYVRQSSTAVPDSVSATFDLAIDRLARWGFVAIDYYLVDRLDRWGGQASEPTWELLCHHPQFNTYAKVGIRFPLEVVDLFEIDFLTQWGDASWTITLDSRAYGLILKLPVAIVQDKYAGDVGIQWQTHLDLWHQLARTQQVSRLHPQEFIAAFQGYQQAYLLGLQHSGKLIRQGERWRLNWATALRNTPRIDRGLRRAQQSMNRRRQQQCEPIELPLALELDSFRWLESRQMSPPSRKVKLWMLLASLFLFALSFIQMLSPLNIGILIGVLLLHEGGHLLAMKWRGYRHHALLFLPWLGAVATAQKEDATVVDKTIVALGGPLPGLLLGCLLGFWTREFSNPEWLNTTIAMLIGINGINLLPLYPLDGGQVVDVLLCSRHPYSDLGFKLIGICISLWLATIQPISLFFVLTIAITIPDSFQAARLNRHLQRKLDRSTQIDREVLLGEIFQLLDRFGGHKLSFSRRYALTKKLLQRYYEGGTSGLARLGLGTFYSLSLVTGLAGGMLALFPELRYQVPFGDAMREQESEVRSSSQME
jgi:Zn-dependent protease